MNKSFRGLVFLGLSLLSSVTLSETIRFYFKHESPHSNTILFVSATKGGHRTSSLPLHDGESDTGTTTNSIFAPQPSGLYHIKLYCVYWLKGWTPIRSRSIGRAFNVASNSKPIHIEAHCPSARDSHPNPSPPENINIYVER